MPDWDSFPKPAPEYPEAAKVFDPDGDGIYEIGRPVPGGQGAGAIPAGLEAFYNQKVTWVSCETFDPGFKQLEAREVHAYGQYDYFAERRLTCGYVIVPLDYTDPAGPTVSLAVLKADRVKSLPSFVTGIHLSDQGDLFFNPGGPGQDSLQQAYGYAKRAAYVSGVPNERTNGDVRSYTLMNYDLVGVSARGTRFSLPNVICESSEAGQAYEIAALTAAQENSWRAWRAAQCSKNSTASFSGIDGKDLLDHSGMINTARDMDVVRSVLGSEKLSYYGVSYGSKLGISVCPAFPWEPEQYRHRLLGESVPGESAGPHSVQGHRVYS